MDTINEGWAQDMMQVGYDVAMQEVEVRAKEWSKAKKAWYYFDQALLREAMRPLPNFSKMVPSCWERCKLPGRKFKASIRNGGYSFDFQCACECKDEDGIVY